MNERPFSKAGYCDACTRWYEIPASGNCDCGGKIMITPGTHFSRELVQVERDDLEEVFDKTISVAVKVLCADPVKASKILELGDAVTKFRSKYLS